MSSFSQAVYIVPFMGMLIELNDIETSMLATLNQYTAAGSTSITVIIGVIAVLAILPMYCALAAPAVAAFVIQTAMFFLSFAPLVYVVGRGKDQYAEGDPLTTQAQAGLLGASALVSLLHAIWVHRTYMSKRIERGQCKCVAYPGFGTLTLLSASVVAFIGVAINAQSKGDYLHVVKAGSLSTAAIVSFVLGGFFELLLPIVSVLWGVGVAGPMFLGTAVIAIMDRPECSNVVAAATNMLNYEIPTPLTLPLDEDQQKCARLGAYVACGCAAVGLTAVLLQLFLYCCVVRPRVAKAKAEAEVAAAMGAGSTINLTVNEVAIEAVPLLVNGAPMGYSGYPSEIAVGTPIVIACQE